jgi:carbon storage regulator CsrA
MLVLSRKRTERIVMPLTAQVLRQLVQMIPEGTDDADLTPVVTLTVVVAEIRDDKTRLGVEAPKFVPVHREEVYKQICDSQQAGVRDKDRSIAASETKLYQDLAEVIASVDPGK